MKTPIADHTISERLIAERKASGADRYDEVWEGVYVVMPGPNNEHQDVVDGFVTVLRIAIQWAGLGQVQSGINVSDRFENWSQDFRIPDISVFCNDTSAENRDTHWFGGPDLAVEVISEGDRTREKFGFYARLTTKELLIVDRDPWALELYRLQGGELALVAESSLDAPELLTSEVLPLSFRLQPGTERPQILVVHHDGRQSWTV